MSLVPDLFSVSTMLESLSCLTFTRIALVIKKFLAPIQVTLEWLSQPLMMGKKIV